MADRCCDRRPGLIGLAAGQHLESAPYGMADVLYGVTMEEHGVSKIVSVNFHKTNDAVTDRAPVSLERPSPQPVDEEEDAPHKREETLEIVVAKLGQSRHQSVRRTDVAAVSKL